MTATSPGTSPADQRAHERFRLDPMYTEVAVQTSQGGTLRTLEGHAYDISEAGARIELDEALAIGERVSACVRLPGEPAGIFVAGRVVWVNGPDEDPAARRMALGFTRFLTSGDQDRLVRHLGASARRFAA